MSFLTGSRVYGTPRPDSDVDLVVMLPEAAIKVLAALADSHNTGCSKPPSCDAQGPVQASLRFGRLNLICVSDSDDLADWRNGTAELSARKPVTRAEAVATFDRLFEATRRWRTGEYDPQPEPAADIEFWKSADCLA